MASSNNNVVISKASPHTIKKFELIEAYIKTWAQKLMLNSYCDGIIYIDCMCNSGAYTDHDGAPVKGSAVRVAEVLRDVAGQYKKKVFLYLNDNNEDKINELKKHLPGEKDNFRIVTSVKDANIFLKEIGPKLDNRRYHYHFFLLYDPYDASIDWATLAPFFRHWGEVLINHMVSDPIRALSQVKSDRAKQKYMDTYLIDDVTKLIPFGSDKNAYEKRLETIIKYLRGDKSRKYYIASFPFFNTNNALVYDLVHCTSHIEGFKLFKTTAWNTFGRKSSTKTTSFSGQTVITYSEDSLDIETETDQNCYFAEDIAKYIQKHFNGQQDVKYSDIWALLDEHPIFPTDGYKNEIKQILVADYGATKKQSTISFQDRRK